MLNFKKAYSIKIIAIAVSISFFCTTTLYPCPISRKDTLRVPSSFQNTGHKKRLLGIFANRDKLSPEEKKAKIAMRKLRPNKNPGRIAKRFLKRPDSSYSEAIAAYTGFWSWAIIAFGSIVFLAIYQEKLASLFEMEAQDLASIAFIVITVGTPIGGAIIGFLTLGLIYLTEIILERAINAFGPVKAIEDLSKVKVATKEAIDVFIKALEDEDDDIRIAGLRALGKVGPDAKDAVPAIIKALEDEDDNIRRAALETLNKISPLTDIGFLPDVILLIGHHNEEILYWALRSTASVISANKRALLESEWKSIIRQNKINSLLYAHKNHPQLFSKNISWLRKIEDMLSKLSNTIATYPEEEQAFFQKQICESIDRYANKFVPKKDSDKIISEYREILLYLELVHDNLPLCLDSMRAINKKASDFSELRKVLPLNNPLTRIIRLLGESKDKLGYKDVTKRLLKSANFNNLYNIILDIAKRRQRQSPQEIQGLLEFLREAKGIASWSNKDWLLLTKRIERYYGSGFKVITYNLFKYFIKHENDPPALLTMKEDMEKELDNIAWGGFLGLSDDFKKKYNISTVDEIALLAKYMPVSNLSARDYEGVYKKIKKVLKKRMPEWKSEVDEDLRRLFRISGSKTTSIYQPDEKDRMDRDTLHKKLLNYIDTGSSFDIHKSIKDYIEGKDIKEDDLKKIILSYAVEKGEHDISFFKTLHQDEESMLVWLNSWHTLLVDTYKQDLSKDIKELVKEAVFSLDKSALEKLLSKHKDKIGKILKQSSIPKTDTEKIFYILSGIISGETLHIFSQDITDIEKELKGFKTISRETSESFYVGLFDDLLHLMGFMMTGVCTWDVRDKQVNTKTSHFGKIALKDSSGRILGLAQVQLLKTGIQGRKRKESPKGWRVLSVPALNLYKGNIAMNKEKGVLALLEVAQRLAEDMNMEGAVIPVDSEIHSNNKFEKDFIKKLFKKGYLEKVNLMETINLTPSDYPYKKVYLIDIPEEEHFLESSSLKDRVKRETRESERAQKEKIVSFKEGLGEITHENDVSSETAELLKKEVEYIVSSIPEGLIEYIRLKNNIAIRIKIDLDRETSLINKTDQEIELLIGKDILGEQNKIDSISLSEALSELFAGFILDDYYELKEKSLINENSYFKLNLVRALFNHRNYSLKRHKVFKNMKAVSQWNLFLNIMDDADPDSIIATYARILSKNNLIAENQIADLIKDTSKIDLKNRLSIASLRNLFKDFILTGKVHLKILDKIDTKEAFSHFDNTEVLTTLKDTLITTESQNEFYSSFKELLKLSLNLEDNYINEDMAKIVDKDIFSDENREEAIRASLEEILIRRIGKKALLSFKEHLTGQRGDKRIPYIEFLLSDLREGEDADDYEALRGENREVRYYTTDARYDDSDYDWVRDLLFQIPFVQGSPQAVFSLMKDGKPRTRKEIAKFLDRSERTIQPDIRFLATSNLLIKQGKAPDTTYKINPGLLKDTFLTEKIQTLLNKRFKVLKEGWRNKEAIKLAIKGIIRMQNRSSRRSAKEKIPAEESFGYWDKFGASLTGVNAVMSTRNTPEENIEITKALQEDVFRVLKGMLGDISVLELGAGIGRMTEELAKRAQRVVGSDISPNMLNRARKALEEFENVTLLSGKVYNLDLGQKSFDLVFTCTVLGHILDPGELKKTSEEMKRLSDRIFIVEHIDQGEDFPVTNYTIIRTVEEYKELFAPYKVTVEKHHMAGEDDYVMMVFENPDKAFDKTDDPARLKSLLEELNNSRNALHTGS